jgi:diacylglycerol kinase family enzyme
MSTAATVIFNANAGGTKGIPLDELIAGLREQGYDPVHRATEQESDLDRALADAAGLVLVAGGDGTIRAAALRLIGRPGVQLAFIPAGTANNISRSFGLKLDWKQTLAGLAEGRAVHYDVGRVRGPLGERYFLEAFGCGLYADSLALYDPAQGKSVTRAISVLTDILPNLAPRELNARLDGRDISGSYLALEAMNTTCMGPNLDLAPDADPSDGLFDVLLMQEPQRAGMLEHLLRLQQAQLERLENVEIVRGRKLELVWDGFPVHFDGEPEAEIADPAAMQQAGGLSAGMREEAEAVLVAEVLPAALTLLLPTAPGSAAEEAP